MYLVKAGFVLIQLKLFKLFFFMEENLHHLFVCAMLRLYLNAFKTYATLSCISSTVSDADIFVRSAYFRV